MSEIYDVIQQYARAEADAGQWSDVATILNTETVIKRHSTPLTYALIRKRLGDPARQAIAGIIRDATDGDLRDAHLVLLQENGGLDVSSDERQVQLETIAHVAGLSAEETKVLLAIGVTRKTPAEAYGFNPVTAQQCQDSWTQYLFEQQWNTLKESTLFPAIPQGRAATVAALRSVATALEGNV